MILVTGATGTTGSALVELLTAAGEPVRAMARRPLSAPGAEVVQADYDDAYSLTAAMSGVEAVYIVTPAGPSAPAQDLALLQAAAGVKRVVKLSAFGVDKGLAPWQEPGEEAVRAGDWEWTILRPSSFATNVLQWWPQIQAGEPVRNPAGDGGLGVIDPRDIAAVAAVALAGGISGVHTLTGPEALSIPQQLAIFGAAVGRSVEVVDAPDPMYDVVRSGQGALVTDDVPRVLGRPARTFQDWAAGYAAAL